MAPNTPKDSPPPLKEVVVTPKPPVSAPAPVVRAPNKAVEEAVGELEKALGVSSEGSFLGYPYVKKALEILKKG